MDGLIVGLRLGYNNEMGLNRNTGGWRGLHFLGREWEPLVGCTLESDNDFIYWYYTGRTRSQLASMHKKTERLDSPVLTILTDYLRYPGGSGFMAVAETGSFSVEKRRMC